MVAFDGESDLIIDISFDAEHPGVFVFFAVSAQEGLERCKEVIEFSDDGKGLIVVRGEGCFDGPTVAVSHDDEQRRVEMKHTIIDGTHACEHLVSDISDGKDMIIGIKFEDIVVYPRI